MRKGRFSEEQIIAILKEQQAGIGLAEICRTLGISDATFYAWRSKYGGMEASDAGQLKALEDEGPAVRLSRAILQFLNEPLRFCFPSTKRYRRLDVPEI